MINVSFTEAFEHMKAGEIVINPNGNYLFINTGKVHCIPKNQFPNGRREESKVYWDAVLSDNWQLTDLIYSIHEDNTIKIIQS